MSLDRADVVEAALVILDEYGLGDLSMRRIADTLGVKAGAIYWHLPNKQTLLAAVSDRILTEVGTDAAAPREWAHRLRDVLLAHRDSAELVSSALASRLGDVDAIAVPRQLVMVDGIDEVRAGHVARALLHLVLGHVVEEQNAQTLARLGLIDVDPLDNDAFEVAVDLFVRGLGVLTE